MISFKPKFKEQILNGTKTVTRRSWGHALAKEGSVHYAVTSLYNPSTRFARLLIKSVKLVRLSGITDKEARKEGCRNKAEFMEVWKEIYGWWIPEKMVWRVEFAVMPNAFKKKELGNKWL